MKNFANYLNANSGLLLSVRIIYRRQRCLRRIGSLAGPGIVRCYQGCSLNCRCGNMICLCDCHRDCLSNPDSASKTSQTGRRKRFRRCHRRIASGQRLSRFASGQCRRGRRPRASIGRRCIRCLPLGREAWWPYRPGRGNWRK